MRDCENGWLITESWYQGTPEPRDRSDPPDRIQYQRHNEDLGVLITLWGDQPDALEDLALNLNQVDETEWQDAVQAALVPFDPGRN